jgi:hypothetical protein
MKTIDQFPVTLVRDDVFTFTHEGATRTARVNYTHVFHEPAAIAEHMRLAGVGIYDGLTLLDEQGNAIPKP